MIISHIIEMYFQSNHFLKKITSAKTRRDYTNFLNLFSRKLGQYHAIQMTKSGFVARIEDMVYAMERTPRKAEYFLKTIKAFCAWANQYDYLDNRKIKFITYKNHKKPKDNHWTEPQIEYVLAVAPQRLKDFVMLAVETGLRRVDLLNLKFQDMIMVNNRYHFIVQQSKTKEMVYIAISNRLLDYLNAMPKISEYILTNNGVPWTDNAFLCLWKRFKRKHDLSITPHGLRKSTVRRLIEADASVPQIAATLGWSLHTVNTMLQNHYFVQKTTVSHIAIEKLNQQREREKALV